MNVKNVAKCLFIGSFYNIKNMKDKEQITYTEEEVKILCKKAINAGWNRCNTTNDNWFTGYDKWFEEHKKK